KIGAMVLKGAARGEFILTDIEGIVESKDVMDLANIHTFVNNSADPDYHLLTSQALFYRLEYSFEHCAPRFSFVGEAENQEWLLSACHECEAFYNPDVDRQVYCWACSKWICLAHSNVHDVPNRRIRNTKALNELTAQEAMLLFQQGPTIRGLGWVKILYPGSLQRGIQGWLVTGNGVLMRSKLKEYPGEDWKKLAWTYDHCSAVSSGIIASAMFRAITGIRQGWKCPNCNRVC
ncbi:hypothetical protein F5880DRAFT_1512079, partial [Lentinula raphanica]